jgi:hypothetical protein
MHAYPAAALGRRAAARRHRARAHQRAHAAAGRRAHGQPRPGDGAGDHGALPGSERARDHGRGGDARPRDDPADGEAGDRPGARPGDVGRPLGLLARGQHRLHPRDDQPRARPRCARASGHDEVRVALRRLDELEVHGPHRSEVLLLHRLERAPAIGEVAPQAPEDAHVRVGVDEELDVQHAAQRLLGQHQDALEEDHDRPRQQRVGQDPPRVGRVVVGEVGHRPARLQVAQVLDEQRRVERVGVVVVDGGARASGQSALPSL